MRAVFSKALAGYLFIYASQFINLLSYLLREDGSQYLREDGTALLREDSA